MALRKESVFRHMIPALDSPIQDIVVFALIAYVLGSIPFGLLLTTWMNLGNLREIGSGNIGATNVLRTGHKSVAALTLVLDSAKGALAVVLARQFSAEDTIQIAALFALLGHCFPIWLNFHGGKGVATFLGIWLVYAWPIGLACCAAWAGAAVITRISSLSAIIAVTLSIIFIILFHTDNAMVLCIIMAALIVFRHKTNLIRLMNGSEPKM